MIIRKARSDEIQQLQNLNDEAFADNPHFDPDLDPSWAQSDKGKEYFTKAVNSSTSCFLVAEDKGKLIGYIAAAPNNFDYRRSTYVEIENLGIVPEYRSQGVGTQLMNRCLTWTKEKGYKKVFLHSYAKNNNALSFYNKQGFSEIFVTLEKNI